MKLKSLLAGLLSAMAAATHFFHRPSREEQLTQAVLELFKAAQEYLTVMRSVPTAVTSLTAGTHASAVQEAVLTVGSLVAEVEEHSQESFTHLMAVLAETVRQMQLQDIPQLVLAVTAVMVYLCSEGIADGAGQTLEGLGHPEVNRHAQTHRRQWAIGRTRYLQRSRVEVPEDLLSRREQRIALADEVLTALLAALTTAMGRREDGGTA